MNNEHHTVLYRKYRPHTFDQVFGQDHIVKVLEGSLELGNVGHAYLFAGPRGTGKTTMARIMARELGCNEEDIIEIDAASNRGIDDIRQLREGIHSLPFSSAYKMYIIDEVHMLTKEAFNALLKTLEEPPSHVVFVLATTEVDKVLPTVISRCQTFTFNPPTRLVLRTMVNHIAEQEGFSVDKSSLELIALLGNGSFRDTQGVLQKLFSYSKDKKITRDEVELITGAAPLEMIQGMLNAIDTADVATVLEILSKAESKYIDPYIFTHMLVESVRNILLIRFSEKEKERLISELDPEEFKYLENLSQSGTTLQSSFLEKLLQSYQNMKITFSPYLALEISLLDFLGE